MPKKYLEELKFNFINYYLTQNKSLTKLAKETGYDRETITKWLKQENIPLKIAQSGKLSINSHIFDTVDTEEKAYWLGFIYADGYVSDGNNFELSLKISDESHLEKFKNFISYSGKVKLDYKVPRARLSFKDKELVKKLKELGCIPRKSLILTFPSESIIPIYLQKHFIRGYFDGDGYISKSEKVLAINLLGTENVINNILNIINIKNIKLRIKNDNYLTKSFILSGDNARNFLSFIYKDATIYLERKYLLYQLHKNKINKKCSNSEVTKKFKWILE